MNRVPGFQTSGATREPVSHVPAGARTWVCAGPACFTPHAMPIFHAQMI